MSSAQCFLPLHSYKVFLVRETPRVDPRIFRVVKRLRSGSPLAFVFVETLNGLDAIHREEATFFVGSSLLL